MEILKVNGTDKNFALLCGKLEQFQYALLPGLKETGYSLTNNLEEINGFVLLQNSQPVASAGLKQINKNTCEIVRVFVEESFRNKGLAKKLLKEVEILAKELNYLKLELVVWEKAVEALALYKSLNFKVKSEKISEYYCGYKYLELEKNL